MNDEHGLLMPFVNVTSVGGKFDDGAFCAGYEMGGFGQRCSAAAALNLLPFAIMIRRDNLKQADLLAMETGLTITEIEMDASDDVRAEWCTIGIAWPTDEEA